MVKIQEPKNNFTLQLIVMYAMKNNNCVTKRYYVTF